MIDKGYFIIQNDYYCLKLDKENGNICSYVNLKSGFDYISKYGCVLPLFSVRLMNQNGARQDVNSDFNFGFDFNDSLGELQLFFKKVGGLNLDATVKVLYDDSPEIKWSLDVYNHSGMSVEWEQFPSMTIPNRTKETKGDFKLFLPLFEGVEVDDYSLREKYFGRFLPDYPSKGWEGSYPGPVSLQYLAYYNGTEGIYIGMHDDTLQSKNIDFYREWNGFIPSTKFLPGVSVQEIIMPFKTVTRFFEGDFYDACDIYRNFVYNSKLNIERRVSPEWLNNPPVTVIYPIRGQKDTGELFPNCYYPYTNALPYLEKLKKLLSSNLLVLLCHWEGSAPWCPPYVWPPYGDLENFNEFVKELHDKGDLLGLYCSGIAWTENSVFTDYNMEGKLSSEQLKNTMCIAPNGNLTNAIICNGWLRNGYDMCPYSENTRKIMQEACSDMIKHSGADYIQLFDQNLGGNSSVCYSNEHGHPHTPGKWQTRAMRELILSFENKNCIFGCEGAASEGFNDLLPYNDGRNYMGFQIGTPVPAYSYVYHEKSINFMGNQNTTYGYLDARLNPENLQYRLGHFFAQGDNLCVVLKDAGKINWDWGSPWELPDPNQDNLVKLLKNLVAWRNGQLHEELVFGKMIKPFKISCGSFDFVRKDNLTISYPSVITRAWQTKNCRSQIFVNPLSTEQEISFEKVSGTLITNADGKESMFSGDRFVMPPFSVFKLILE